MTGRYSPVDPVALGSSFRSVNVAPHAAVPSLVVGTNAELMEQVAALWIKEDDVVVDSTFGRGVFWKHLPGLPHHAHDLKVDGVDLGNLPHADCAVDVVALDPPYRPSHGSKNFGDHSLAQAYGLGGGGLDTIEDVLALYRRGAAEAWRVLNSGGRLICKSQDMTYGHRLHLVSLDVLRIIEGSGFKMVDQFILGNEARLQSSKWQNQERARRAHSVLWVAAKVI